MINSRFLVTVTLLPQDIARIPFSIAVQNTGPPYIGFDMGSREPPISIGSYHFR